MGLLDRFEQRLDRMVNGAFARAFKAEVQPVEIAAALQREMDDRAAVVSRGRTVVPNVFVVDLSPHDHDRLSVYADTLTEELAGMVREYAEEQRYTFVGGISVDARPATTTSRPGCSACAARPRAEVASTPQGDARTRRAAGRGRAPAPGRRRRRAPAHPRGHPPRAAAPTSTSASTTPASRATTPRSCSAARSLLRDLGSTNGTYVDGVQVGETVLHDGAVVQLGGTRLTFRAG